MPRPIAEVQSDVAELKRLLQNAERNHVKDLLSLEIRKLETEISLQLEKEAKSSLPAKTEPKKEATPTNTYTVKISTYGWDQSEKFVKLFITLPKVQSIPQENVSCTFNQRSVELMVKQLEGKNYSFGIKQLYEEVDPSKSHWKIKTDMVVIFLAKSKLGQWTHITASDKKTSENAVPKLDQNEDPSQSLMKMLKQMYDEGDDEMKRTIAKSWSESRNKQSDFGDLL